MVFNRDGELYRLVTRKAIKGEKVYVSTVHDSGFFTCMGDSAYTEGSIKISENGVWKGDTSTYQVLVPVTITTREKENGYV